MNFPMNIFFFLFPKHILPSLFLSAHISFPLWLILLPFLYMNNSRPFLSYCYTSCLFNELLFSHFSQCTFSLLFPLHWNLFPCHIPFSPSLPCTLPSRVSLPCIPSRIVHPIPLHLPPSLSPLQASTADSPPSTPWIPPTPQHPRAQQCPTPPKGRASQPTVVTPSAALTLALKKVAWTSSMIKGKCESYTFSSIFLCSDRKFCGCIPSPFFPCSITGVQGVVINLTNEAD